MELVEDHDAPEDYDDPDWDASMDIRNEQSPDRHVDQNNEFFSVLKILSFLYVGSADNEKIFEDS